MGSVILHVVLHPHACCEFGSHPIFLFPTSDLIHHSNNTGELGLRLDGTFQVESLIHKRLPKLPQYIFPRVSGSFTSFGIWPTSPCPLVEYDFLFTMLPRSSEGFCTLVLRFPALGGANAKTSLIDSSRVAWGYDATLGPSSRRRPRSSITTSTTPLDPTCTHLSTKAHFCRDSFLLTFPSDPEPRCRHQREFGLGASPEHMFWEKY